MQAPRSPISHAHGKQSDATARKPLVELQPHRLGQVAGGLPRIGSYSQEVPVLLAEPLPRIGS